MIEYDGPGPERKEDAEIAPANGFERGLAKVARSLRGKEERVSLSRDLYWALRDYDAPKARRLMLGGAPLEETAQVEGSTVWDAPLISAARARGPFGVSAINMLLSLGADPDAELASHRRPINLALLAGQWAGAGALIKRAKRPLERDEDGVGPRLAAAIALMNASDRDHRIFGDIEETLGLLREIGADPNERLGRSVYGREGSTPLMISARLVEATRELLGAGARANESNDLGATALMIAAGRQSLDSVRMLLAGGADPLAVDGDGRDALDWMIHSEQKMTRRSKNWGRDCEAIAEALMGAGLPRVEKSRLEGVRMEEGDEAPEWALRLRSIEESVELGDIAPAMKAQAKPERGRRI